MDRHLPVIPTSPLPPLYAAWVDDLLSGPIPRETDATCDNCSMVAEEGQEKRHSDAFFNPQTKCCSYVPKLPNYLVGNILNDRDPAVAKGRASVQKRIRAGVNVSPLGLDPPPEFQLLYGHSSETLFGQSESILCPHYLSEMGGRCGIWKHRASVCTTWHCKYVRGAVGHDFWSTLHQLLSEIERTLSRWCVLQLDVGNEALRHSFPPPTAPANHSRINPRILDGKPDPEERRKYWGVWFGREEAFYVKCARLVSTLSWEKVLTIGGPDLRIAARLTSDAYSKLLSHRIPERLKVGPIKLVGMNRESCQIVSYSRTDPLVVPRQLFDGLHHFDGRPIDQALDSFAQAEGIRLDEGLVRKLADFAVLVPGDSE